MRTEQPCWLEGFDNCDFSIEIAGSLLSNIVAEVERRDDLLNSFGPEAERWGFVVRCILPLHFSYDSVINDISIMINYRGIRHVIRPHGSFSEDPVAGVGGVFNRFIDAARQKPGARILEIGSRARSGITNRGYFAGLAYTGFDIVDGPNVDIVGDAHKLSSLVEGKYDFIYSISTFEHMMFPLIVAVEINRAMNSGGLMYAASHQTWPVHDAPWDFFRFSKDAWGALFNAATGFELVDVAYSHPAGRSL